MRLQHTIFGIIMTFTLTLFFSANSSSMDDPGFTITRMLMCEGIADREPVHITDAFSADMEKVYLPVNMEDLNRFLKNIPKNSPVKHSMTAYIQRFKNESRSPACAMATAEEMAEIRQEILTINSKKARLALLDLSNALE